LYKMDNNIALLLGGAGMNADGYFDNVNYSGNHLRHRLAQIKNHSEWFFNRALLLPLGMSLHRLLRLHLFEFLVLLFVHQFLQIRVA
jgi:hypothetical protein